VEKPFTIVTESPLNLVTSSGNLARLQLVSDEEAKKLLHIETESLLDKSKGVETTTPVDNSVRVQRIFNEDVDFERSTTPISESWMNTHFNYDFVLTTPTGKVVPRSITPEEPIKTNKEEISKSIDSSSTIATKLESSTTKYIGRLDDESGEEVEKPKKVKKVSSTKISKVELDVTTIPTAVLDQSALGLLNLQNDIFKIDETNDVVTAIITGEDTTIPVITIDEHKKLNEVKDDRS